MQKEAKGKMLSTKSRFRNTPLGSYSNIDIKRGKKAPSSF